MTAPVIAFESAVAAKRETGGLSIALMDTSAEAAVPACVAILLCSEETGRALARAVKALPRAADR